MTTSESAIGDRARDPSAEGETARPADLRRDIVVIGASAGGVETLRRLMATLPEDFPASIFVAVHMSADARSELPAILTRAGPLQAVQADDGVPIKQGRIYVAQPDRHLLLEPGRMRVVHGPLENRHRPAIDPLFRSAAWAYGPRAVGVVLSGGLDDGTAGLWAIKTCGGTTVVQEPAEALYPEMPSNALTHNQVDYRVPLSEIGPLLVRLATEPVESIPSWHAPESIKDEIEFAKVRNGISSMSKLGRLSPFTCPACRGALWEIDEGGHLRYRCHTGHAFSPGSLLLEQSTEAERSVYVALRAVEEKAGALRRLAKQWKEKNRSRSILAEYETRASELEATADVLRALLAGEAT